MTDQPAPPVAGEKVWLRCERTGKLCGTDTWAIGYECSCNSCQVYMRGRAAVAATQPAEVEDVAALKADIQVAREAWQTALDREAALKGQMEKLREALEKTRDRLLAFRNYYVYDHRLGAKPGGSPEVAHADAVLDASMALLDSLSATAPKSEPPKEIPAQEISVCSCKIGPAYKCPTHGFEEYAAPSEPTPASLAHHLTRAQRDRIVNGAPEEPEEHVHFKPEED